MASQIEWKRRAHEEIDRLEACMVDLFLSNAQAGSLTVPARSRAFKQKLLVEHQLATLQDQMSTTANNLLRAYENQSKDEESSLEVEGSDLGPFYSQLKIIKDHHRRQSNNLMAVDFIEIETILEKVRVSQTNLSTIFTGEERNGRFLDLHRIYDEAINLCGCGDKTKSLDYLTFLQVFDRPVDYIPESKRGTASYSSYLSNLLNYLLDFIQRTRPLSGYELNDEILKKNIFHLEAQHKDKELEIENSIQNATSELFCEPCDKLFTNSSVFEAHLKGKKHQKHIENYKTTINEKFSINLAREKLIEQRLIDLKKSQNIEIKELKISIIGEFLKETKTATRGNVERRQALTAEERTLADQDSDFEDRDQDQDRNGELDLELNNPNPDSEGNEDDGRIYNPLKLPLDWDGKPIPFWLWKLHGLGVPFTCEICGNFVYMGRRAFDQHFYEWRHSHGMKCLGVPNTSHFFQITKIADVKMIWDKMRTTAKSEALRADWMEECEDSSGNVYDRRTFDDLKRQGLL